MKEIRMLLFQVVVVHIFHSNIQEAKTGRALKFEAIMVYGASSRAAWAIWATQRTPASEKQNQKATIIFL